MNTGIEINNNFYGRGPGSVARSVYARQVEQIFSGELRDRGAELAELAEFCTRVEGPAYVWWQAPAWAGKSALMAAFVKSPPAGVRVVSFFITARLAGQSDRAAFLEAVLMQLAEVTGQPLPDVLTESNRQQWFLQLLEEAAGKCAGNGCRLVLVVDGLDEDRGVQRSADAHSIANLLPGDPPAGVRIIVSGRPNPPVPADVPDWHPLRDPQIVRLLETSRWAVAIRDAAGRELSGLLDGGGLGRDLLGLLIAAGGGLTARDLSELTDRPVGEVRKVLQAVTGRSFSPRQANWVTDHGALFVLAHEELVHTVREALHAGEITAWRDRVHAWAESYRDAGWPAGTPEYLLRGYLQMLHTIGDLPRMRATATDTTRIDRMLDVSGGDAAALADLITILVLSVSSRAICRFSESHQVRRRCCVSECGSHPFDQARGDRSTRCPR
ncbi:P-loop domain-containing protein [Actinocorallia aurea]